MSMLRAEKQGATDYEGQVKALNKRVREFEKHGFKLDSKSKKWLALENQRAKTAKSLAAVYGDFKLFESDRPTNVMGFVENHAGSDIHLNKAMLDTKSRAMHVLSHEANHMKHIKKGIRSLDAKEANLTKEQEGALDKVLNTASIAGVKDFNSTNLIEGFVERRTQDEMGVDPSVAYANREVRVVKNLEAAVKDYNQTARKENRPELDSPTKLFFDGDKEGVYKILRQLAEPA